MARFTGRSAAVPQAFAISHKTFEELDTLISSLRTGSREFQFSMSTAAQLMAKTTQAHAHRLMRGPQSNPQDARRGSQAVASGMSQIGSTRSTYTGGPRPWTIPVRRITGRTYRGWRVKPFGFGAWEVFNEERGAYMVEFGIVRGGHGIRRPILRMSGIHALNMARETGMGKRLFGTTFGQLQMNKGRFTKFNTRMEGTVYLV